MTKVAAIAASALLLVCSSALAEVRYNVTDLGDLGQHYADPLSVNRFGQVAGISFTADGQRHAFFHDGSRIIDITATSGAFEGAAFGVNDQGQVVGFNIPAPNALLHGFIWSAQSGLQDLGTLGGNNSHSNAINNAGEVVGDAITSAGVDHAFLWRASTGMTDLGAIANFSQAYGINDHGQIVGWTGTPGGLDRAFVWTATAGMVALGTLGGRHSFAYGINNLGQIVGEAYTADQGGNEVSHAFLWSPSSGMIDLGTLGGISSDAESINDSGQIVGHSALPHPDGSSQVHAFLWEGSGMLDINDLIDRPTGWHILQAHAINNVGQIVGIAVNDAQQWGHGVLLTPIPEPAAAGVALSIGTAAVAMRRRDERKNSR
jgi:probable HAF family extracellular repeat protein